MESRRVGSRVSRTSEGKMEKVANMAEKRAANALSRQVDRVHRRRRDGRGDDWRAAELARGRGEGDDGERSARRSHAGSRDALRHGDDQREPEGRQERRHRDSVGEAADAAVRVSRSVRQAAQGCARAVDHRRRANRVDDAGAEARVHRALDAEYAGPGGRRDDRLDREHRRSRRRSATRRRPFCVRSARSSTWPTRRSSTWRRPSADRARATCSCSWKR